MSFAKRTGMLCALVLACVGAAPGNGAVRLLERMRDAAGPVWTAHVVSVSRLTYDGEPAVVSTDSEAMRLEIRHCTGELCDGTYFDGERLFSVDMNGTTLPLAPQPQPYLRSVRIVAALEFLSPSFLSHGGTMGDVRSASFDGRTYQTFVVGDRDSIPMRLFVDPQTNLVRYARQFGGSDTFEFLNYRRVGAFMLPFEVRHDGALFERYDDRAAVSSAFHPPHGFAPATGGLPATVETDRNHVEPIVSCSVGGLPLRCLLDTGNSGLSISSEVASRIDAPVVGSYRVRGLGGYTTQVVRAGPLRIGSAAYPEAYYVVLDDLARYGYDVVLGADVFGGTGVVVDLGAHVVRFGASLDGGAIAIPISFERFVPVAHVGLGDLDADLAVDTGDESNVNLGYDFYQKHPGLFEITTRRLVGGIGGSSVEMIGEIGSVTIGGYRTGPQRIGTTQNLQGTASGHLGAAFLQQFIAGFDYAAGILRLIPRRG